MRPTARLRGPHSATARSPLQPPRRRENDGDRWIQPRAILAHPKTSAALYAHRPLSGRRSRAQRGESPEFRPEGPPAGKVHQPARAQQHARTGAVIMLQLRAHPQGQRGAVLDLVQVHFLEPSMGRVERVVEVESLEEEADVTRDVVAGAEVHFGRRVDEGRLRAESATRVRLVARVRPLARSLLALVPCALWFCGVALAPAGMQSDVGCLPCLYDIFG